MSVGEFDSDVAGEDFGQRLIPLRWIRQETFVVDMDLPFGTAGLDFNQATDSIPPKVLTDGQMTAPAGAAAVPPSSNRTRDTDPLDAPITEEFRVGTMTIAWDPSIDRVVIELFSNVDVEEGDDEEAEAAEESEAINADEVFVVKITAAYARDFVARANALVSAGRPPCPFCLQPLDPQGHICPRANGYRRPLF